MVILSYPLQLDPSRRCLTSLVYALMGKREQRRQDQQQNHQLDSEMDAANEEITRLAQTHNPSNGDTDSDPAAAIADGDEYMKDFLENVLFYGITCAFLVLSFIIAMSVSDLGVILGVVGATGSTTVSYILPGKNQDEKILCENSLTQTIVVCPLQCSLILSKNL